MKTMKSQSRTTFYTRTICVAKWNVILMGVLAGKM